MSTMPVNESLMRLLADCTIGNETEKLGNKTERALKLLISFENLCKEESQCDFEIRIGAKKIPSHRSVLAASSTYFKAMLKSGMKEANQGYVEIRGLEISAVKVCLDYIYSGEINLKSDEIEPVLKASDLMQLDDLTNILFAYILDNITVANCLLVRHYAMTYHSNKAEKVSKSFISRNFASVAETEQLQLLDKNQLQACLKLFILFSKETAEAVETQRINDFIQANYRRRKRLGPTNSKKWQPTKDPSTSTQWRAIANWVDFSPKERGVHLLDLLKNITPLDISSVFGDILVHPLITSRQDCEEFLMKEIVLPNLGNIHAFINLNNFFAMSRWAKRYDSRELKNSVLEFMIRNFGEVAELEGITELDLEDIKAFLVDERTSQFGEESKYNAIIKWTRSKELERLQYFEDLFSQLRLNQLSVDFIHSSVRNEPLVKSRMACYEKIMDALYAHAKHSSSRAGVLMCPYDEFL